MRKKLVIYLAENILDFYKTIEKIVFNLKLLLKGNVFRYNLSKLKVCITYK